MPTLSVVMIVKNEAACLAECLDSVRGMADALLVGDTGSTDGTQAVARAHGAVVFDVPWQDDFAAARNGVLERAEGDWLLHLDADELLDPEGARRIRELVDADGRGADAIEITLANYCDAPRAWRWTPVTPGDPYARGRAGYIKVGLLRLFRNRRGFEYREPVHENITESVRERGGVIVAEPIVIHHYGYDPAAPRGKAKAALYLAIARRKAERFPEDPKAWCDLAELLFGDGDAEGAESAARRALDIAPLDLNGGTMLANLLLNQGALDEARGVLEQLEAGGVAAPHVVTALGAVACRQGRLDEARRRLESVVAAHPDALMARQWLARTLDRLGDVADARRQLERAVETAPTLSEFRDQLQAHDLRVKGEAAFGNGAAAEALKCLVAALRLDPEDPVTHNDLGGVLTALGEPGRARQCFERARRLAPDMPEATWNRHETS